MYVSLSLEKSTHNYSYFCFSPFSDNSFKEFFHHEDNLQLWDKFKIYHIDAPGQVSSLAYFCQSDLEY